MTLPLPDDDWSDCNVDDRAMRLHIPELLDQCLASLGTRFDQTKSDLARNGLMLHVYGRYLFEQLVAAGVWRLKRRQQVEDERKFSLMGTSLKLSDTPRSAYIAAFGKNTVELKVWLPHRLDEEVSGLAIRMGLTPAEYARRALTAYYVGRTVMDPMHSAASSN